MGGEHVALVDSAGDAFMPGGANDTMVSFL
jgi:hypothetical protein